jgi:hypothetical protein
MNITADAGSRIVRQSKEYISIPGGKTVIALMSGVLVNSSSATNVMSRIGMFDNPSDVNVAGSLIKNGYGVFFQYKESTFESGTVGSTGLSLVLRQTDPVTGEVVDTEVYKDDWNLDTADGQSITGANLDPTKHNTFVFCFGNMYGMSISAGIIYNGRVVLVHEFALPATYNYATRVPLRWEIGPENALLLADPAYMIQKNASVYSSTKNSIEKKIFSASSSAYKNLTSVDEFLPIFSLRLNDESIRAKLRPKSLSIINLTPGGVGKWELRMNPVTLTGVNFTNVSSSSSFADFSTAETATGSNDGILVSMANRIS